MDQVLMFDLGGVLVENDMFDELAKLIPRDIEEEVLKNLWLRSQTVRAFELGMCSPDEFATAMVDEFELSCEPQEFIVAFKGWPKGFYNGVELLLQTLRSQHLTACLSNSNELHWTTKVTDHFDRSYSSHLLRRIKPDAEVFQYVTQDIGCAASDIVFFDDSRLNIDAARSFGWRAHLTVGYGALIDALRDEGLTT